MRALSHVLITAILVTGIAGLTACGEQPPSDPSRIGDGIGSTASERAGLNYDPVHGCAFGTELTLNPEPGAPSNQILCGVVENGDSGKPVYVYQGIQYAASPAGDARWTDPKPPQWRQLSAVEYGPKCPQGSNADAATADINEDCLYLNVWSPKITSDNDGDLPVMVFIHGGAFIEGSGGSAQGQMPGHLNLYDGIRFVSTARDDGGPIVFVTMNYRLGALGLMAGLRDGTGRLTGNYAIKDQTKALEWVQRNISLFGGDPDNVMIFGESAGAQSVALHLTITDADHQSLFDRAIIESNYAIAYMKLDEAAQKANTLADLMKCPDNTNRPAERLACLRQADLGEILEEQIRGAYSVDNLACAGLQAIIPWNPVIDGQFITQDPINATHITKPFINGTNLNESIPFISWVPDKPILQRTALFGLIDFLFGERDTINIIARYQREYQDASDKDLLEQIVTDYLWTCFNRKLAEVPGAERRRYHDIHHPSFPYWVGPDGSVSGATPMACAVDGVVCHADELPFVFGNPTNTQLIENSFTADEADLSLALRRYWIAFARTGDPNVDGQTSWPLNDPRARRFRSTGDANLLQIQAPASSIVAINDDLMAKEAFCQMWDQYGYTVRSSFDCSAENLVEADPIFD